MLILSIPKAADGNRTHDLFLTKEVLYRLSYSSDIAFSGQRSAFSQRVWLMADR
jgi:hypothetical protein